MSHPTLIHERVALAREGKNPYVIGRMSSGWLVMGDVQPVEGYCVLLSDPVVGSLNELDGIARIDYLMDTVRIGDALLKVTGSYRINYETLCNLAPALHTHVLPRFKNEPEEKRHASVFCAYDWTQARKFDAKRDQAFIDKMREALVDCITDK